MNRKVKLALLLSLATSGSANVYLYLQSEKWQEAWLSQLVATSTVEQLLNASSPDLSYTKVKALLKGAEPVTATRESQSTGADRAALEYGDTTLLFRSGYYYGSKADLPDS